MRNSVGGSRSGIVAAALQRSPHGHRIDLRTPAVVRRMGRSLSSRCPRGTRHVRIFGVSIASRRVRHLGHVVFGSDRSFAKN